MSQQVENNQKSMPRWLAPFFEGFFAGLVGFYVGLIAADAVFSSLLSSTAFLSHLGYIVFAVDAGVFSLIVLLNRRNRAEAAIWAFNGIAFGSAGILLILGSF